VSMPSKIRKFKQPAKGSADLPSDKPMVIFSFQDRRFSIEWTITELFAGPAEVIPIQRKRPAPVGNGRRPST
jgi:hypothetical protein